MKKLFIITPVLAMCACNAVADIDMHDKDFYGCERIVTNETHLVYKCPSLMERIVQVKNQEPDSMFLTWGDEEDEILIKETAKDENFTLVEVVLNDPDKCTDNFHYRTMIKPIGENLWSVISCK